MEARFSAHGPIRVRLGRALVAVLLGASLGASAATVCWKPVFTDEELRWIKAHPVVHIAVEANWYPIEYMRNRQHGGLVAGYLSAISKMTGLTFETVPGTEWGHAYAALASGKVDLLPGVWRELAPERIGAGALISSPYLVGRLTAVTRNNSAMIFSLQRLKGRRVAIKGRGAVEYFTRHSGVPLDVLTYDTEALALAAVANGEADAALGVDVTILPIVRRQFFGQLYMSGMLADRPVSLAMLTRTDLPILASIIDKSLAAIPVKETAAITRDWVELGDYGKPTIRSILHYRAPVVLAIVVTLVTFAMLTYLSWKSRAAAIRSRREKAMFLAFVSHEIRTPMQTILSSLEFLQRSGLSGQQAERAEAAAFASDTLLTLLDDILEHSRLESRKVTLSPHAVELEPWARQTVDMVRWRAERKALALTLDVAGPRGTRVVIDPVRVRQIVLNLLVNAINFTAAGAVTLRVHFFAAPQGRNGTLLIEVRDTGVGIAPDRFRHLFDAYWQADCRSRQGAGGSGLGLAICRELVELMHGTITVDSTPHVETVFTVQLPVTAAEAAPPARRAATAPVTACTAVPHARRDAPRILIVDDHEAVQAALRHQCDELGCAGLVAGSGEQALRQLAHEQVDMVLLDCNLPDIDGYALARMIRQEEATRKAGRVPIIAISAVSGDAHRVRCLESGMDGVLGKPLRFEALRQAVVRWCPTYTTADGTADTSNDR
ncbi:response regulator [Burkholderia stagnalis]|uniref:ATP-binding protein n=1 Tax=Burkholderia stagnalis TaxID=1503054 RepID=UPI000F5A5F13|nr:ATP-binding protein [Burkholderia stagnalis]RQQ09247.1 response regulator [Burkholderia stagnalis]RQQ09387.1 response regulator [Burkholderia stagnalis]RQQ27665.1 response regulator [Burkholderia stagnalis]RQQ96184.1 response regulator [Burkholderia stagnalis]RQX90066.1 response regulator [Burkholderia stagnalis]